MPEPSLIPKPVLEAAPEHSGYTDIGDDLKQILASRNLVPSWQRVDSRVMPVTGLFAMTRQMLEEMDSSLADKIVKGHPSVQRLNFEDDVVRRGDCVLMLIHQQDRDKIMDSSRDRALAFHARNKTDLEQLGERLASLEHGYETTTAGDQWVGKDGKSVTDGQVVKKKLGGPDPTTKVKGSLRG